MAKDSLRRTSGPMILAAAWLWAGAMVPGLHAEPPTLEVYKSPWCGCCTGWVDHLRAEGLTVTVHEVEDLTPIKRMAGVPDQLQSCHTAVVEGYTIEGHVPATAIERLLRERPAIDGLAAPGMPAGSPGMPSPTPERYDVIAFGEDGETVFETFVGTDAQ